MKILRTQAGFTITELMAVIVISGFLMTVAATGFGTFFSKFDEMNKTMELQRDAFNCLQTIKNGIPIGSGTSLQFQGIATADSVVFSGTNTLTTNAANSITLYPPLTDQDHLSDYVKIFYDGTRYIRAQYAYGQQTTPAPLYLFPKNDRDTKLTETKVTKLLFSKYNNDGPVTKVVKVELEAQKLVRIAFDYVSWKKIKIYKKVSYTTLMAVAM